MAAAPFLFVASGSMVLEGIRYKFVSPQPPHLKAIDRCRVEAVVYAKRGLPELRNPL